MVKSIEVKAVFEMRVLLQKRQYFRFSYSKSLNFRLSLEMEKWSFMKTNIEASYIISRSKSKSQFYLIVYFIADVEGSFLNKYYIIAFFQLFVNNFLGLKISCLHFFQKLYHEVFVKWIIPIVKRKVFKFIPVFIKCKKLILIIIFINISLK